MIQSDNMMGYFWILNLKITGILIFLLTNFQVLPQWTSIMDVIKKVLNTAWLGNKLQINGSMNSIPFSIFESGILGKYQQRQYYIVFVFLGLYTQNRRVTGGQFYSSIIQISNWCRKKHGKPCKDMDHVCLVHCCTPNSITL